MFARNITIRPKGRGLGKLALLISLLYLPFALAQDTEEPLQAENAALDTTAEQITDAAESVQTQTDTLEAQDAASAETEATGDKDDSDSRHIERFGSSAAEEWEMDLSVPASSSPRRAASDSNSLPDRAQNQELQSLLGSLAVNPGDAEVMAQLDTLLNDVLRQVYADLDAEKLDEAEQLISVIQPINPTLPGLRTAQRRLGLMTESNELLATGNAALQDGKLIQPENDNAYYYFTQAQEKYPDGNGADLGLARVQAALIARAYDAADSLDFELAEQWLGLAEGIRENQTSVDQARVQLAEMQSGRGEELTAKVNEAIESGDFNLADFLIIDLIAMGGQEDNVSTLRAKLKDARYYSGFQPGQVISDPFLDGSDKAPDIVIIPEGSFMMGSEDGNDNEKPRHRVNIERGFGLGVTEITVAQFRLFVLKSGYRTAAEIGGNSKIYNESAGRLSARDDVSWMDGYNGERAGPDSPVLHVSWHDAQAYVKWLSQETGKNYRLPTEIEYEYVARAGSNSDYWWGEGTPSEPIENLTGEEDESPGDRQWTTFFDDYKDGFWGPAPVGSLRGQNLIHPFGLYDIAGNVSEWIEDCWHPNYTQAPDINQAWVNPGCERRVARGGYWASAPGGTRAAFRISANPNTVGPVVGFRIARDL